MPTTSDQTVHRRIANETVRLFKEHTGRGPTKARTYISDNLLSVVMQDVLTDIERHLVESNGATAVRQLRWEVQERMREELIAVVEAETGRKVVAFMSANHVDPDMALESFVLADESI